MINQRKNTVASNVQCTRGRSKLCVCTIGSIPPSETFIRHHITRIAPGEAVVVCIADDAPVGIDEPVLLLGRSEANVRLAPLNTLLKCRNLIRTGNTKPLSTSNTKRLTAYMIENRVTAVLAEYGLTGNLIAEACRNAGARLFVHFHGWDISNALQNARTRWMYRRLTSRAESFICVSEFARKRLIAIGIPRSFIRVIPCGVDTNEFKPASKRIYGQFAAVGRFVEKKAPQNTIKAFAAATRDRPESSMRLVGYGPLLPQCRKLIRELGMESKITLHGAQPPEFVASLLAESYAFVQHSITAPNGETEGLPVAVLEAMSSGLPIISTRHAGIPEAVSDGENGYLVDENDVDGMAEAIRRLLDDPDSATEMGAVGRNRAKDLFSARRQMTALRELLGLPEHSELSPSSPP